MIILQPSSFTGKYSLAKSTQADPIIQNYIDANEGNIIRRILGVTLGNLFIANIDATTHLPVDARFLAIYNSFQEQPDESLCCGRKIWESLGMKEILKAGVYDAYVRGTQVKQAQVGTTINQSETGTTVSANSAQRIGESIYNESLDWIEAIQWYCKKFKPEDYSEFKGVCFEAEFSSLL